MQRNFFFGRTTFSAEKNAYERLITSVGYIIYTWMYLTGTWFERSPLFSFCLFILFAKNLIRETGLSRPADGFDAHPNIENIKFKNSFLFEYRLQKLNEKLKSHRQTACFTISWQSWSPNFVFIFFRPNIQLGWGSVSVAITSTVFLLMKISVYKCIWCDHLRFDQRPKNFICFISFLRDEILNICTRADYLKNNDTS